MTAKCGTYKGWNQHQKDDTPVCTACREAARQYQKQWRANSPQAQRNNEIIIKAGQAAKRELANRYPDEYKQLYQFFKKQLASSDGS